MGRSFWILYDITPLHAINETVASSEAHLFAVQDPYRLKLPGGGFFNVSTPDEPQYRAAGAYIDYYLASEPEGELKLEILDASDDVIRAFSSESDGEQNVLPEEASMREWRLERIGTPKLPKKAGMNRFLWDLRHAGPWDQDAERSGRRGPTVKPGMYQARLTMGDWSRVVSFTARMDPRVVAEGRVTEADVEAQEELSLKARDALSSARLAAHRVEQALESASGDAKEQLTAIHEALVTAPVRYSQPMLVDQLAYLFGNLNTADQRPGRDAVERYNELKAELDEHVQKLDTLLGATDAGQ
jgi:hypothetical protein